MTDLNWSSSHVTVCQRRKLDHLFPPVQPCRPLNTYTRVTHLAQATGSTRTPSCLRPRGRKGSPLVRQLLLVLLLHPSCWKRMGVAHSKQLTARLQMTAEDSVSNAGFCWLPPAPTALSRCPGRRAPPDNPSPPFASGPGADKAKQSSIC